MSPDPDDRHPDDRHPDDRHPDDLLSAYVDGELDATAAAQVAAHLSGCAPCRAAEAELLEARSLLRSLPGEDASPVIEGFLARHRTVIRVGAGFVAVAALGLVALALNAATYRDEVVPDVDALVAAHLASAPGDLTDMEPQGHAPYDAPPGLIGSAVRLSRHQSYDGTDLSAVVYRDGALVVTVFQQPGRLDWDRLPPGSRESVAGQPVWFGHGQPVVAVVEKGDLVVTVVSPDRAGALTVVGGLPEWEREAAWDRVHDACQRLTRVFALGG